MKNLAQPESMKNSPMLAMTKDMPYPREISFDESELPEIADWKVGAEYTLVIKVQQLSIGADTIDKESEKRARFRILAVEASDKKAAKKSPRYQ